MVNAEIDKEIKYYEYLLDNPNGQLSTLLNETDKEFVDRMQRTGIVRFGLDSAANRRYQVTSMGERIIRIELRSLRLKKI